MFCNARGKPVIVTYCGLSAVSSLSYLAEVKKHSNLVADNFSHSLYLLDDECADCYTT